MRKILLLICAILSLCLQAVAQNVRVSGTVTDDDGAPVTGVTVVVKGTQNGTISGAAGKYSISVPKDAVLVFSSIGYQTKEVAVAGKSILNVTLSASATDIDDVVVIGYGTGKKISSTVGTVSQVKADKIETRPSNNVVDALQGQVAGLQIMTGSGELDQTSSIRLHGYGSINAGNEPLVLLDGAPITTGTLLAMNQNDIASISVLKDASATSIYGSRAANGVIYVTSKKGSRSDDCVVTLRTQYSMSSPTNPKIKAMSSEQLLDHLTNVNIAYAALDGENIPYDDMRADLVDYYGIEVGADGRPLVNTNWFDEIMRKNAPLIQTDLSVSGGSRKTSYYVSANYSDQEGILPGSDMTRYTFRSNIETQAHDWVKLGMSLGVGYHKSSNSFSVASMDMNWFTNPVNAISLVPAWQPAYDENGDVLGMLEWAGDYASPLKMHEWWPIKKNRIQLNGNLFVELTPVKGLTVRSSVAANGFDYRNRSTSSPDYKYSGGTGSATETFQRNYDWTLTNTAEYKFDIARNHGITLLVGQESIYGNTESYRVRMKGISDSRFLYLNHGTGLSSTPTYKTEEYTFNSVFGRLEYNFADKYFVDLSLRNDASSRFGSKNRNAMFYSAGAMWNVKKESFLKDVTAVSALSLKVNYGTSGNSGIGNYDQYATLAAKVYGSNSGWVLDGAGNPELAWEKQSLLTAGFNVGLLNKLNLEVSYYERKTTDMLLDTPITGTSGFTTIMKNVGSMRNNGVDITLGWDIFRNRDWAVNFHATYNYNHSRVTSLYNDQTQCPAYDEAETEFFMVGEAAPTYVMVKYLGVDTETGEPMFQLNEQGGVTNDFNEAEMLNLHKSWLAPHTGGFGFNVAWKGLSLAADFSWVQGNWMFNNTRLFSESVYFAGDGTLGQTTGALDYWKKPGDKAFYPSLEYQADNGYDWAYYSDALIEDGSFLRLKNLQLSYSLPSKILRPTKCLSGVKVWVGARNLLTFTKYTGLDPEVDGTYSLDNYPNSRQVTFGLELKF